MRSQNRTIRSQCFNVRVKQDALSLGYHCGSFSIVNIFYVSKSDGVIKHKIILSFSLV